MPFTAASKKLYLGKCILIVKTDLEKYYHRMHTYGVIASACISIIGYVAHLLNIIIFDSTPDSSKWCVLYKTLINIANDLLDIDFWDPNKLLAHNQSKVPSPTRNPLSEKFEFSRAKKFALITGPKKPLVRIDGCINDKIGLTVNEGDWVQHASCAMHLSSNAISG